jgi:hypothetical protein
MGRKYILIIALVIIIVFILFLSASKFLFNSSKSLILTDPVQFGLTNEEIGQPHYLDKGEYDKKESEEFFAKTFGFSNGYTQVFADSNYFIDVTKTLSSLNETDRAQRFLAYRTGITISVFDSVDGASRYYDDRVSKSYSKTSSSLTNLGDEATTGYNDPENNVCYFEKCNQAIYWLIFRKRNIVVLINRNLDKPTTDNKIIDWGRIIESKIK